MYITYYQTFSTYLHLVCIPHIKTHYYQVHKTVAAAVLEEIAKPLKVFGEIQHKARKATEALVGELFDKYLRFLTQF